MIGFFIKKSFFDGWDNLIGIVLMNILFVLGLGLVYLSLSLLQTSVILGVVASVCTLLIVNLVIGTVSFMTNEYVNGDRPGFSDLKDAFLGSWKGALLHSVISFLLFIMVFIIIPFYGSFQNLIGVFIIAMLFWLTVFFTLALLYLFPIMAQLGDNPLKALKKCFLIVFDNILFSIFLLIYTLVNLIMSILTALLLPGITGILMSHQVALKLLLLKYDFLEEQQEGPEKGKRRKIPWDALLIDEQEKVGHRTLRGMIFPWKE